jgi:hypothetical protein
MADCCLSPVGAWLHAGRWRARKEVYTRAGARRGRARPRRAERTGHGPSRRNLTIWIGRCRRMEETGRRLAYARRRGRRTESGRKGGLMPAIGRDGGRRKGGREENEPC